MAHVRPIDAARIALALVIMVAAWTSATACGGGGNDSTNVRRPTLLRVASYNISGRVVVDLQRAKMELFGRWLAREPKTWGLLEVSLIDTDLARVRKAADRPELRDFDPDPSEFKPITRWIDEGESALVITWSDKEVVYAIPPRHSLASVPEAARQTYATMYAILDLLNDLQYLYRKGTFDYAVERTDPPEVKSVPVDDARVKEFLDDYGRVMVRAIPHNRVGW